MAESTGNAGATSPNPDGGTNVGLWQLDTPGGVGAGYSQSQLSDPNTNAKVAIAGSKEGTNWSDWSTYASGAYKQFMSGAAPSSAGVPAGSASASTSTGDDTGSLASIISSVTSIGSDIDKAVSVFVFLANPSNWVRIGAFFGGVILLALGVHLLRAG
jgi:hypothetical protein